MTCSSRGLPPTSCNTLGSCDLSLVPLPAAMMATAIRGAELGFDGSVRGDFTREIDAETDCLLCNFFIRPQDSLPLRLWLFQESCTIFPIVSGAYLTKKSAEEERAEICHRTRHPQRGGCDAGKSHRHFAKILQRPE